MCRYVEIAIVLVGVLAMSEACHETVPLGEPQTGQDVVRFTLDAPRLSTRGMAAALEDEVSTAEVLVFDAGGLVTHRRAASVGGSTFEVSLPAGVYDLMVVGNAPEAVDGLAPRTSKADVLRRMTVTRAGKWDYSEPIPLWGHLDGVLIGAGTSLTVDVYRMLTRVDVQLSAAVTNFELRAVWLANNNTVGLVAPDYLDATVWDPTGGVVNPGKGVALAPTLPANPGRVAGLSQEFTAADGVTAREALRTIYTFEAAADDRPCLVVGGGYAGSAATTWYRVDFAVTSDGSASGAGDELSYLPLLRNHDYVITIRSVSGPGLATAEDALTAVSNNISVGVQEWQDGGIGPIEL